MPKTIDIPHNMREFNKIFEQIAYRHDYSTVFNDFLDFSLKGFSPWDDFEELNKYGQSRYSEKESLLFGQLIIEFIQIMNREIVGPTDWFDALGTFYEILASKGKRDSLGQFFTPSCISDFMAQILIGDDTTGKLINEPCSGSGRFVISFHAKKPGNYFFAEDIDKTCCKMTAINMCLHGVVGVVINHNSLFPDDFRSAWVVNEVLNCKGLPSIRSISFEEIDLFYRLWKPWNEEIYRKEPVKVLAPLEMQVEKTVYRMEKVHQLSLFS